MKEITIKLTEEQRRAIYAQAEVERTLGPPGAWSALWQQVKEQLGE